MEQIEEILEDEENIQYEEDFVKTKSLRKLIFLVAFTAIMLVSSTYAWFSSQKNVSIQNITGKVNVAEGLQISLDAKNWSGSLDLSSLSIINDAYIDVDLNDGTGNKVTHTNYEPTELLPVSTTGTATGIKELAMYRGTNTETVKLDSIVETAKTWIDPADSTEKNTTVSSNPDIYPGYFAFDIFLQNSGIKSGDTQNVTTEVLQLNTDSQVTIISGGNADVGLQNTVRVGFALYSGYADVTADQATVLAATNADTSKITDVSIWEPNSKSHVENIVTNNNFIKWDAGVAANYVADASGKFADGEYVPTYALTSTAKGSSITDIYDWKTTPTVAEDAGKLGQQYTVATGTTTDKVMNLKSTADGTTNFEILKNTIVKLRVYVWLEGQDVDCTNYASHGGGIEVNIGLIKGQEEGSAGTGGNTTSSGTYLPTGFTEVAAASSTTGLTIKDSAQNEYVWIEVPKDATVYSASTLSLDLDSLSGDELTDAYDAIESDLHTYTSTYRNGTSYTDTWYSEAQHGFASADEYNALKYKMLKSVFENGGFYIGKYEAGTTTARTSSSDTLTTPVIQANAYPYNFVTNAQAQSLASGMSSGEYTSSLMFGVQWDLVLKYLETKGATTNELNSDSTSWGNYMNNLYNITNTSAKYYVSSWTDAAYGQKASSTGVLLSTGASDTFSKQGIYDLAGNVWEWTLEYTSNTGAPCAYRGGNYNFNGSNYPASNRNVYNTTIAIRNSGFRVVLY